MDTLVIEATLRVFRTATCRSPACVCSARIRRSGIFRLPTVRLQIPSVLAAADSNADLRPARGPLAPPWWERVPWRWVLLALGVAALAIWLVRRLSASARPRPRRRRRSIGDGGARRAGGAA